jgi:DNA mismatch repair ATPase MutS
MLSNPALKESLVAHLRMTFDSLRLVQKFSFGRGDPDDLVSLSRTIQVTGQIARLLEDHIGNLLIDDTPEPKIELLRKLLGRLSLDGPNALSERILDAIDEDMLDQQHMIEDSQAAEAIELAETVLSEAGEEEPPLKGIPKSVKARLGDKEKDSIIKDDVWIMRRRYLVSSRHQGLCVC